MAHDSDKMLWRNMMGGMMLACATIPPMASTAHNTTALVMWISRNVPQIITILSPIL